MAWFKVDDQLAFHPKAVAAGNAAMGLWVRAGAYASAHLTDGKIAKRMATAMATDMAEVMALVEAGLWTEVEDGYQIHDWDDWQPDAETERQRRRELSEKRKAAGRKGAASRWGQESPDGKNGKSDGKSHNKSHGTQDGKTMAPSPSPSLLSSNEERGRKRPSRPIPDDWAPTDSHREKASRERIDLDKEARKFQDNALAHDRRYVDWDRAFHNWLDKDWVTKLPDQSDTPSYWR